MALQALPQAARDYSVTQRREAQAAVAAVLRLWRRMGIDFDQSYDRIAPSLLTVVRTAQGRIATGALVYVPDVLEETGQVRAIQSAAAIVPESLVGVAGDGRPVDTLLYGAVTHAKERVSAGATATQALRSASLWMSMTVGTLLSDTGRQSESLAIGTRPVGGYVRMLNPPSCARCVVLAGKWYRKNAGFQRHPGCDCRHIPASESIGDDLTVNSAEYFDQLSSADQDRVFTKAGAEAIRNGADLNKVVNARRGMYTAQAPSGRQRLYTREGGRSAARALRSSRGRRDVPVRLMPETISQLATDRDDYLRLLRANGYIL
ncbi:hypothetical protein [Cellulomonas denverensis]|uniref:Phage head morphogenesis domain-containing protein n=1 Tax=Cellulomonas denverensis TaxID=264297 RepID=A0A7X6KTW1_9CELL|nr:hypothetical protein [Cellulomonas denverensis]NKY22212.1 hypothetical protein [Cellulomonas denverensis]GIG27178.1 hypothetical protein Cde04nite_34220 [Cellulomonas denverensis]